MEKELKQENTPRSVWVVPCHNEALRLKPKEFETFCHSNPNHSFLFINDGSTDNTAGVLSDLQKEVPKQCQYLNLNKNRGKAEAVRLGILKVFEEYSNVDYVGYIDADLATPLDEIPRFIKKISTNKYNIVMGSRVSLLGKNIKRKLYRHYIGRFFATLVSNLLKIPVYDTQCGAKLFVNSKEMQQIFREKFITKWIFDVEILSRYLKQQKPKGLSLEDSFKIYELPLNTWHDVQGSKLKPTDFILALLELYRIYKQS